MINSAFSRFGKIALVAGLLAFGVVGEVRAKRLTVVTTFTIIADMARNVAGDRARVLSITRPGAEIHGYQPTPQDLVRASKADLLLWNGMNLELWFERFFARLGDVPAVVVSEGIVPVSIGEGAYQGKPNPHAWMSPQAAEVYLDNIRDALSEHAPEHARVFAANTRAYKARLRARIAPLRAMIDAIPQHRRWLVTSEGAFSYLTRDFAMRELYLWPINADRIGTPKQVRAVIDAVRVHTIPVVFSESTISPKPMQRVAAETNTHYGGVLYVDSLSKADGPVPDYLTLLERTIATIVEGYRQAGTHQP